MVKIFLAYCGDRIPITEEMVIAAFGRYGVVEILVEHYGDRVPITEEVVKAAIKRDDTGRKGWGMVELILKRYGDRIQITEEVMKATAASYYDGRYLVREFLDRYGEQVPITGGVLGAAVKRGSSDIILLLLSGSAKRGEELDAGKEELIVGEDTMAKALLRGKRLRSGILMAVLRLFSAQHRNDKAAMQKVMEQVTKKKWGSAAVIDDLVNAGFGHLRGH